MIHILRVIHYKHYLMKIDLVAYLRKNNNKMNQQVKRYHKQKAKTLKIRA